MVPAWAPRACGSQTSSRRCAPRWCRCCGCGRCRAAARRADRRSPSRAPRSPSGAQSRTCAVPCRAARGKLRFQPLPAPAPVLMTQLLEIMVLRVLCCLERDGLLIRDPEQPWLDLEARDALDALGAASIQYRIAVGPQAGRKVLTVKLAAAAAASSVPRSFTVARDGFSLNAAVACAPHQRDRIERLCRYITRPALALERLSTNEAGQVVYQLTNR